MGQNELQVIEVEAGGEAFITKHIGNELVLLVLEHADLLFHRIAGEQAVGDNLVLLADSVRTVNSLAASPTTAAGTIAVVSER